MKFTRRICHFNVWISGTNGKTTTTKMMQHLLESKGSVMGGNVGIALANLDPHAKIWILETSSFTPALHKPRHTRNLRAFADHSRSSKLAWQHERVRKGKA